LRVKWQQMIHHPGRRAPAGQGEDAGGGAPDAELGCVA